MPTALGLPHCLCVSLGPAGIANVAPSRTHAEAPRPGTARSAGPPTGTLLPVGGFETKRVLRGVLERGDIYAASGRERALATSRSAPWTSTWTPGAKTATSRRWPPRGRDCSASDLTRS